MLWGIILNMKELGQVIEHFRRSKIDRRLLLGLYKLTGQEGVVRFTLSKGLSLRSVPIAHTDLVMRSTDQPDKMYIISSQGNRRQKSLQIADFKVQEGVERVMFFKGTSFASSVKARKSGPIREYQGGQIELSREEQVAFLNEITRAQVDEEATQKLLEKVLTF